jgi:hypothetical protein
MAPGLRSISIADGYGFVLLTMGACPPLAGASVYDSQQPLDETACFRFNRSALDHLRANQNIRIVILVSFWELPFRQIIYGQGSHRWILTTESDKSHAIPTADASQNIFTQSLKATICNLQEAGKEVIVIQDVPNFDFDPVSRLGSTLIPARHALARRLGVEDSGIAAPTMAPEASMVPSYLREAVEGFPSVNLVDLKARLCRSPGECAYRDGDQLLYADSHHLSPAGARYVLRDFKLPVPLAMNQ